MRLSALQKYILVEIDGARLPKYPRKGLERFYAKLAKRPSAEEIQNIITKSLERLIDKGLLIGFGRRTPQKWFIDALKLTSLGRRTAKSLLGEQQSFPLFRRRPPRS